MPAKHPPGQRFPRPKRPKLTRQVLVMLSDSQYERLDREARNANMRRAELIRVLIEEAIPRRGAPPADNPERVELDYAHKAIGSLGGRRAIQKVRGKRITGKPLPRFGERPRSSYAEPKVDLGKLGYPT